MTKPHASKSERPTPPLAERASGDLSFWGELGLTDPPEPLDDALAPPINRLLLQKLVRRQLPASLTRAVLTLTYHFASWKQAYLDALVDEQRK
jgi:hypothetical protein